MIGAKVFVIHNGRVLECTVKLENTDGIVSIDERGVSIISSENEVFNSHRAAVIALEHRTARARQRYTA